MSHGTIECGVSAPRDHTGDVLRAAFCAAVDLHNFAVANIADAERCLALARLAAERARENEQAARAALVAHLDREEARA